VSVGVIGADVERYSFNIFDLLIYLFFFYLVVIDFFFVIGCIVTDGATPFFAESVLLIGLGEDGLVYFSLIGV
jgi:hypothetical protein